MYEDQDLMALKEEQGQEQEKRRCREEGLEEGENEVMELWCEGSEEHCQWKRVCWKRTLM